jgi:transposase
LFVENRRKPDGPGYDPRDLLKLYLYGYLHQVRSSRQLEAECQRNLELVAAALVRTIKQKAMSGTPPNIASAYLMAAVS